MMSEDLDAAVAEILELVGPVPGDCLDPSWSRVDLAPTLAGIMTRVMPTVLRRDDGAALFYPVRVNGLHADSGIGKSMVCAVAVAQELDAGHHCGWVDLEDPDPSVIVERLRMFGVDDTAIAERFHYWSPREPFTDAAVAMLASEAFEHDLTLMVVDSLGEAFSLEAVDENKDVDVGPWLRRVARVVADAGPAVILVDHATKAADNPLHPSGSKRKRAAITGASYLVEATRPLTRDGGGTLRLTCAKDRHGNYRRGDVAATIDLLVYPDGGVSVKVWPPLPKTNEAEARVTVVARAAIRAVRSEGRLVSQNELVALMDVRGAATLKRAGIEHAVARGALRTEPGPNRSVMHAYVCDLDDPPNECVP